MSESLFFIQQKRKLIISWLFFLSSGDLIMELSIYVSFTSYFNRLEEPVVIQSELLSFQTSSRA